MRLPFVPKASGLSVGSRACGRFSPCPPGAPAPAPRGALTATRALKSPSSVDVAGLGAVLSASVDLGDVTVTRGHAVQTGSGNESIKRYYKLSATGTNSGLSATLTHSYQVDRRKIDLERGGGRQPGHAGKHGDPLGHQLLQSVDAGIELQPAAGGAGSL